MAFRSADSAATAKRADGVTVMVIPGGGAGTRTVELSRRRLWVFGVMAAILLALMATITVTWVPLARKAATADELALRVDSLLFEQSRVVEVVRRVERMEAIQGQLERRMRTGGSIDSALWVPLPTEAAGGATMAVASGTSEPTAWPLAVAGALTRTHLGGAAGDHRGIDIAVPGGSYVRAAGDGEVVEAAEDPDYGLFILIDHGNGLRTRYGHASYLIPDRGWRVRQGEVIALSGSSGRSTAPHLHFEILRNGRPIDPFTMVTRP
ncbi:MAG: M23 family metallopeptidase [Gemmatimonadetes bacterium]|nr:M23 family metallopeptidase [Gemmatimonadota bacterium]